MCDANANTKPLLRGHFHQGMFFTALGGLTPLLLDTRNSREFIAIAVYSLCALAMFGTSALYHRIDWKTAEERVLWKKLDHMGIYLMIAGCFTPICLLAMTESTGTKLLTIIWSVAAGGILQSFLIPKLPKIVSAAIYIAMGYLCLPHMSEISAGMGQSNVSLLLFGGVAYTIGGVCYGLKRPALYPRYGGYHEVFHVCVNIAAALQFFAIRSLIYKQEK